MEIIDNRGEPMFSILGTQPSGTIFEYWANNKVEIAMVLRKEQGFILVYLFGIKETQLLSVDTCVQVVDAHIVLTGQKFNWEGYYRNEN